MDEDRRADDETLADTIDAMLTIARKLALRGGDRHDIVPLTGTEVEVIRAVARQPGATPTQVAAITGLRRSNVSVAVRVLETQGLLTRTQADDARSIRLTATESAFENMQRIRAPWVSRLRQLPEPLLADAIRAHDAIVEIASSLDR